MTTQHHSHRCYAVMRGFSLVELMVVVTIVAILASIAYPLYTQQVRKSRRTDAKSAVLDLAGREERLYSTTNCYTTDQGSLGYGAAGAALTNTSVGSGYYTIGVATTTAAGAACPTTYAVTATAASPDQLNDTDCRSFSVDQTGRQSSANAAVADSTATCWR